MMENKDSVSDENTADAARKYDKGMAMLHTLGLPSRYVCVW